MRVTRHEADTGYHEALNESMCPRVTVRLFISKSYIQLDTTHSCLLHPEAELPLYLLGSHLEFLALNGSPSPVDLTKGVGNVVCIIIDESTHRPRDSPDV